MYTYTVTINMHACTDFVYGCVQAPMTNNNIPLPLFDMIILLYNNNIQWKLIITNLRGH